jgi:hypothetical protein
VMTDVMKLLTNQQLDSLFNPIMSNLSESDMSALAATFNQSAW